MKNKFVTFLFILLCMGFGINEINAGNIVVGNGISINVPSDFGNYTDAPIAVSGESSRDFAVGIRFSLVTADGITVMSKNYFYETVDNMYVLPGVCNKLMYTRGNCTYSHTNWTPISASPNVSELENIFASQGLNIRVSSGITSGNLSRDYVFGNLFAGTPESNLPKIKNAINQLLSGTGKTIDNFRLPNETYNLFIEWEPLARIRISEVNGTRHYFYGTTYELSNFVTSFDGFNFNGANCAGSANRGYCNFGKAVGKILGCSVFLDSSNSMGQIVRENIGGNLGGNFQPTSYFGGRLNLNWNSGDCAESIPSSSLKDRAMSSNSSSGVGVIWIGEFGSGIITDTPTCYDIYTYYGGQFSSQSPYTRLYVNGANSFNFSAFNNYWKTINPNFSGIDTNWFKTNCPGPEDTRYNCTPNYNIPSCTTGDNQNLTYSDTGQTGKDDTYWQKCVFNDDGKYDITPHKTSAHNDGNPTYYDSTLSSKYCEVYCVEDVIGNLSANNPIVLAGSHFVWGASSINTVRTCRTKNDSINWGTSSTAGSFYYDLNVANQGVADALAWNQLKANYDSTKWIEGNPVYTGGGTETITFTCSNADGNDNCGAIWQPIVAAGGTCGYTTNDDGSHNFTCTKPINGDYSCTNYRYQDSTTKTVAGYTGNASIDTTVCSSTGAPTNNPVSGDKLTDAISKVNSVLGEMDKCFNFADANVLNVQTSANISYISEGNMYNYTGPMAANTQTGYSGNTCTSTISVTALTNCSGTGCTTTTKSIKKCDTNEKTGNAMTTLNLTGDVYRYVLKNPNGKTLTSIHGSELEGYKSGTLEYNWIDIGYANFPVPYNFSKTKYTGALNIQYSKVGHINSGESSTTIDRILSSQRGYGTYGGWSCDYTVKPDLIPESGPSKIGINVIYREIDLARPFPDIDASNRATGANWCSEDSCAWNNYVSDKYILNNRNVVGKAIYDLDPMYTFIMTPSDIIKIRRYNDKNQYSSYTGSDGAKTYNFKCVEGTGRGCRSEYLTELMNMLDTANYPGTCKSERGVTDIDTKFNACRY